MTPPVPSPPPAQALRKYPVQPPDIFNPNIRYPAEDAAQHHVYNAWEVEDPTEKFQKCLQALQIFPFSVDAYNCMADTYHVVWKDMDKAQVAYDYALKCARLLWPQLEQQVEIRWGVVENRPLLRTYHGLGCVALEQNNVSKAIGYFRFLLAKNPTDNQGIRMLLFLALLEQGEYQQAEQVAMEHSKGRESEECYFRYGFVLIDFLKMKLGVVPPAKAEKRLVQALQTNNFVPLLLIDSEHDSEVLGDSPSYVSSGQRSEAVGYVRAARATWKRLPGNPIGWLQELRDRNGPKPNSNDDDGSILFDLLTKGKVLIEAKENAGQGEPRLMEATTKVGLIPGTGLDTFQLPSGMTKEYDPSKPLVFYATGAESNDSRSHAGFQSIPYSSITKVHFWSVLKNSKIYGNHEKHHSCRTCHEEATLFCTRCKVEWYCSKNCQKKDWKQRHKVMCDKFIKS